MGGDQLFTIRSLKWMNTRIEQLSIGGMISLLGFFMIVISITRVFKLSGEMPDDKDALKIKFDLSS